MEWVTGRVPDKRDLYLVTIESNLGVRYTDALLFNPRTGYWIDEEGMPVHPKEILAWAEMPKPWEG